jgi:Mannosyltransferase (PIG-V)
MSNVGSASPPPTVGLPGWVRAADLLAVLLAVVAAVVAMSGGFRLRIGGLRLALTSPYRPLLLAAAIVAARHALTFTQHESMAWHLWVRLRALARLESFVTAAAVTLATRPIVFLVGYLAVFLFGYAPGARPFHDFDSELLNLPLRWDAGWYLQIATEGYEYTPRIGAAGQQNIVFFPGYPLTVRAVGLLFGNNHPAYVFGAVAVSVLLFLVGLAYLYELAREYLTPDESASALWMLGAYPFALFYGTIYTESMFLAGAAGAFYHFRRDQLGRAALWGLLVGLTRPNGFFLCVPLAICAFEGRRSGGHGIRLASLAAAAAPVGGVLLYSLYIWRLTGNPIAWAAGHVAWGRTYQGLSHLVTDRYQLITESGLPAYLGQQPYDFVNALGVIFVLAAVWPLARRFSLAYAAFILINILPPLSTGGLMSAGRFSSVLFPAFLWLASAVPAAHRMGWIAAFAALEAFNAALFYTWRPLF